jgi:dihydrolipoamide dehydrogenase
LNMGVKIGDVKTTKKAVSVTYTDADGKAQKFDCDKLIVSVGRVPNTDGLNLEAVGLKTNDRGQIDVDAHCQTLVAGIYAVGDVIRGAMLAHKAEEEGVMVAEIIRHHSLGYLHIA